MCVCVHDKCRVLDIVYLYDDTNFEYVASSMALVVEIFLFSDLVIKQQSERCVEIVPTTKNKFANLASGFFSFVYSELFMSFWQFSSFSFLSVFLRFLVEL